MLLVNLDFVLEACAHNSQYHPATVLQVTRGPSWSLDRRAMIDLSGQDRKARRKMKLEQDVAGCQERFSIVPIGFWKRQASSTALYTQCLAKYSGSAYGLIDIQVP